MSAGRAAIRALVLAAVFAALVGGCGIGARRAPVATPAPTAVASIPVAIDQARLQVAGALRAAGYFLDRAQTPFRPPESPALAVAPRTVFQVVLPDDPGRGQIVIYELPDPTRANEAGREMAVYLASGPGRVQFPPDARHTLRQFGSTLIFYTWSRENAVSDAVEQVATILESVGQGIAIPQ